MNTKVPRWSGLWVLIVALGLTYIGCSRQHIDVALAEPVRHRIEAQLVELRNCDGKTELHRSLASEINVEAVVSIPDEATAVATGETAQISPDLKAKLEAEVERTYQETYERAKTDIEQTELKVPVGRIRTFKLEWGEQAYSSTVSFSMNDEVYTAPYTYKLCVPKIVDIREIPCTG